VVNLMTEALASAGDALGAYAAVGARENLGVDAWLRASGATTVAQGAMSVQGRDRERHSPRSARQCHQPGTVWPVYAVFLRRCSMRPSHRRFHLASLLWLVLVCGVFMWLNLYGEPRPRTTLGRSTEWIIERGWPLIWSVKCVEGNVHIIWWGFLAVDAALALACCLGAFAAFEKLYRDWHPSRYRDWGSRPKASTKDKGQAQGRDVGPPRGGSGDCGPQGTGGRAGAL
jgi:hypothetical protein